MKTWFHVLASVCAMSVVTTAYAEPPTPAAIPLTSTEAATKEISPATLNKVKASSTLVGALTLLSQNAEVGFVVEGRPYHNFVNPEAPLLRSRLQTGKPLSLKEVVAEIARAYDYYAEGKAPLFLLRKRYGHADDVAEVTLSEMKHFLDVAARLGTPYVPSFPHVNGIDVRYQTFSQSLTPEQVMLLQRDTKRPTERELKGFEELQKFSRVRLAIPNHLPASRFHEPGEKPGIAAHLLSFPQQQFLYDVGLNHWLGEHLRQVQHGAGLLNALDANTYFAHKKVGVHDALICFYRHNQVNYEALFSPISRLSRQFAATLLENEPLQGPDPSDPQPSDYDNGVPRAGNWEDSDLTVTLGTLVDTLTASAGTSGGAAQVTYTISPALRAKRVTLVGTAKVKPDSTLTGAANLFNLSVEAGDGTTKLTFPPLPKVKNVEALGAALRHVMPRPLLTICEVQAKARTRAERTDWATSSGLPLLGPPRAANEDMEDNRTDDDEALSVHTASERTNKAVRRLRVLIEPRLGAARSRQLHWKALTEQEKTLTAWIMASDAFTEIYRVMRKTKLPSYLTSLPAGRAIAFTDDVGEDRWLRVYLQAPSLPNSDAPPETVGGTGVIVRQSDAGTLP